MKGAILCLYLFLIVHGLCAQIDENVGLRLGFLYAQPTGEFASDDFNNPSDGMADIGMGLDLVMSIRIVDYLGISFGGMYNAWRMNTSKLYAEFQQDALNPVTNTQEPWECTSVFIGPFTSFRLNNSGSLSLFYRLHVGYTSTQLATMSFEDPGYVNFQRSSQSTTSLSIYTGFDLRWIFLQNAFINLHLNYFSTNARFEDVETYDQGNTVIQDVTFPITSFMPGLSVGLIIGAEESKSGSRLY